jgi:hypothetical protein
LTWDFEKKRRKVVVHHTPTGGSTVVVEISVPLPYGLRSYGVERPPLSWLWFKEGYVKGNVKGGNETKITDRVVTDLLFIDRNHGRGQKKES